MDYSEDIINFLERIYFTVEVC